MSRIIVFIILSFSSIVLNAQSIVITQDKNGKVIIKNAKIHKDKFQKRSTITFLGKPTYRTYKKYSYNKNQKKYSNLVKSYAQLIGVDKNLAWAIAKTESNFNPRAKSHKGATGIMQLMPETAKIYGFTDLYNAEGNIKTGLKHFKYLKDKYKSIKLALAAYNAGESAVLKYNGVPPYQETQRYISKIMNLLEGTDIYETGKNSSTSYYNYNSNKIRSARISSSKIYSYFNKDGRITLSNNKKNI